MNVTCSVSPCEILLSYPLFDLTTADAAEITGAVLLVWVVGFAIRVCVKALRSDEVASSSDE